MNAPDQAGTPLPIAVVGHTNTGKTSLLRTLARDAEFGEVADAPATTRQVEGIALTVGGEAAIELYDTPGLEQASTVYEWLQAAAAGRHDGPDRIGRFLESHSAGELEQEARVLDRVLASRLAIYVIDAREPVLEKYQDELAVLAMTARPVLPVLNFVAMDQARPKSWREALARVGLHTVAAFDTVVFEPDAERQLWQRLAGLVPEHQGLFDTLIDERARDVDWRRQAARRRSAEFLIDAAAARQRVPKDDKVQRARGLEELNRRVLKAERACMIDLAELFRFSRTDWQTAPLPALDEAGSPDLLEAESLRRLGLASGKYAGSGLAAGAAFDLSTGGLSLGMGTVVGAVAGAGAGGLRNFRHELADRFSGHQSLALDAGVVRLLLVRQRRLLADLFRRGHAADHPFRMDESLGREIERTPLPAALNRARFEPGWSRLGKSSSENRSRSRHEAVERLAGDLARELAESS